MEKLIKIYMPMTETAYYILLSLLEKRHGYGIIQYVHGLTNERIKLGAGTIYTTLSKMEKDGLIIACEEVERRKLYIITDIGKAILDLEINRLEELYKNGINIRGNKQ